ncbi:MAG: cytochrome c biogenesis CcdA family protein [Roseiarcus sp.]|jgi:cytochrome c-type biogenesis protein|uniref:cytochrome c biogenesis CcdA family protein n=1 Tax=Roseiarcus sp. TaxID=1969460 RepID=UPI003C1FD08D
MTDISLPAAAGAGLISFLSPCVLPLAPPYLCYLAGASIESLAEEGGGRARRDIVVASLLFVAGFATVFVALGATATEFSLLLHEWSHALSIVAGLGIIVMGAHFLGLFRVNAMLREARLEIEKPPGLWSAYLMGVAFAFGWTPCIGPILAAIFAVAAAQQTVGQGALLLAAYSLGLGAPFVVAAIAMERFLAFSRGFRRQFARLEKATGALLVVTGVLFLTGGMQTAAQWLIDTFPRLGQLG